MTRVDVLIDELWDTVLKHRRYLHAHPELSGEEKNSAAYIAQALRDMGLSPTEHVGGYGVTAVIEGCAPGKCLGLRADFDALPLTECTGLPFASETPGVFHACGHDTHAAMLLGTAAILCKLRQHYSGCIKLIFQPSEENAADSGARRMIADQVLEAPKVDAILAQHVSPCYSTGEIAIKPGVMTASTDRFFITVHGKSSHGAQPDSGVDAIVIGAQIITALQSLVSRTVSPLDSAVISIGKASGGNRYNVVADQFYMEGTCRTLDPGLRIALQKRMEELTKGIAQSMGGHCDFTYVNGFPPVINDQNAFTLIKDTASGILGQNQVHLQQNAAMTGEDFSCYGEQIPSAFYWLGCRGKDQPFYPLHNVKFTPDEEAMKMGIHIMVSAAMKYLR